MFRPYRYQITIPGTLLDFMTHLERHATPYRFWNIFSPRFGYLEYQKEKSVLKIGYMQPYWLRAYRLQLEVTSQEFDTFTKLTVKIPYSVTTNIGFGILLFSINMLMFLISMYTVVFDPSLTRYPENVVLIIIMTGAMGWFFFCMIRDLFDKAWIIRIPFDTLLEGYFEKQSLVRNSPAPTSVLEE